jgi:mRNA interferase MazF
MKSGIMPERGELLLVPFPFSDLSATKRRPVLALTVADRFGDFIALPVTSRMQIDHALPVTVDDLINGALPATSWIRTNRIVTLNVSLVVKVMARVSEKLVATAARQVCDYISWKGHND